MGMAGERNLIPSPYVQKSVLVMDKKEPSVIQRKATAQSKKCQLESLEDKQNRKQTCRAETLVVTAERNKILFQLNSIPCPTLSLLTLL